MEKAVLRNFNTKEITGEKMGRGARSSSGGLSESAPLAVLRFEVLQREPLSRKRKGLYLILGNESLLVDMDTLTRKKDPGKRTKSE
jgi:hypothetical protein